MPKKPTQGKNSDKPEVEDAEVVAEMAEDAIEDAAGNVAAERMPEDEDLAEDAAEPVEASDEIEAADETPDDGRADEAAEEHGEPDHADDFHDEHERRGTLASYALSGLVIFLIGVAIALWAAPRVAPHLPAGLAKYLETGSTVSGDDLASLRNAIDGRMRALESKTLSVATVTDIADTQLDQTRKTLEARIGELADKVAAADSSAIEGRLSAVETSLAGLESRFSALSSSLTDISTGGAGLTPEDAARIAGFAAAVEGLRAEIASLSQKSGALSQRIDEVAAAADRRVEEAESAAKTVKAEAETTIKGIALVAALDQLETAVGAGGPFAEALARLDDAAVPAPEALAAYAATGVPSLSSLRSGFPAAAHDAIAAAVEADAGEGFTGRASAWFKAQITGLPVSEMAGDDAPAILSRVSARLAEGDLAAALAEADALPEAAAAVLAPWKTSAEHRRDALAALADWRAALGANG